MNDDHPDDSDARLDRALLGCVVIGATVVILLAAAALILARLF